MNKQTFIISILAVGITYACNNGPKVISASKSETKEKSSGIFSEENSVPPVIDNNTSFNKDLHTIVINEILPTTKYVYLKVTEAGEQFWIATGKQDVIVGNTYFYRGGLLKTNFESKEYDRLFEKIYLVTNLVSQNHGDNTGEVSNIPPLDLKKDLKKEEISTHTDKIIQHKGSIKISEIVANPKQYEGKSVQITGKCVKVNPNIMQRNWIHLQDGSSDSYDLVITTNTFIPEGQTVTIRAVVSLNRDFGAGYRYDLILENGQLIN